MSKCVTHSLFNRTNTPLSLTHKYLHRKLKRILITLRKSPKEEFNVDSFLPQCPTCDPVRLSKSPAALMQADCQSERLLLSLSLSPPVASSSTKYPEKKTLKHSSSPASCVCVHYCLQGAVKSAELCACAHSRACVLVCAESRWVCINSTLGRDGGLQSS